MPAARRRERRLLLTGGLSAMASVWLSGCGRAGKGSGTGPMVTTQLGWLKDIEFAGIYVADSKGFFSQEGIDSRLLGGGPNATTVSQGVSGGSALFGVGSQFGEIASAVKAGSNLVVVGAIQQRSLACVISLPTRPIAGPIGRSTNGSFSSRFPR